MRAPPLRRQPRRELINRLKLNGTIIAQDSRLHSVLEIRCRNFSVAGSVEPLSTMTNSIAG